MNEIIVPEHYNYIGVFLTLRCNLNCEYCINHFNKLESVEELSTDSWVEGLSRIRTRQDLPITLQGGEPTIYPGFYKITHELWRRNKHMDLLTNGTFDLREFCSEISPEVFRREAKYASLRFSYHRKTNIQALTMKVWAMQNSGYEIGIWGLAHPEHCLINDEMEDICKWLNIDYRKKEYLGYHLGELWGTYKYTNAVGQKKTQKVQCRNSELLINPAGYIFRCHADLYANRNYIGHILDNEIKFPDFEECNNYGHCNPCDIKLKFNRFQETGHCAVEIKGKEVNDG